MANKIRFEVSANNEDLDRLSQQLEVIKKQQIELARQAQAGEKTISEAIKLQSDARKEQLGVEKLLATARKANAEEQKNAINNAINAQNNLVQSYQRELGLLEKLRAELKEQKKAREQATDVASVDRLTESIKGTQAEINKLTGATDKFKGSNGFWQDMRKMVVAAFAVDTVIDFGKSLFDTQVLLDSQKVALRNVLNSQKDYEQSLSFLTNLGDKYGQSITGLTQTYTSFIASSQSSGLELKERQKIYESIIKAGSALTLSNEQIEGSLLAVSQMFSKGKVSSEELRQQLGERLPGAFGIFAKALNVSEIQLDKMLSQGEVLASDALPKFAKVLEETYGAKAAANITTFGGAWNRLTNNITLAVDKFSTSDGVMAGVAKGINYVADGFKLLFETIENGNKTNNVFIDLLMKIGDAFGSVYDFTVTLFTGIKDLIFGTDQLTTVSGFLSTAFDGIVEIFKTTIDVFSGFFNVGKTVIGTIVNLINNVFGLETAGGALNLVLGFINTSLKVVGTVAIGAVIGVKALVDGFLVLLNEGKKVANFFGAGFKIDPKATFGNLAADAFTNLKQIENIWKDSATSVIKTNKAGNEELLSNIKLNNKKIESETKASGERIAKEKIDSDETLALIREKTRISELEKTQANEQKLLGIEKDIAIKRINESKASATKKTAEILKIEEKFRIDLDNLTDKYEKQEAEELKKSNEERKKFSEGLSKVLEKIEEEKTKKIIAYNKKLNEDKNKLDEEYKKEFTKNQSEQLRLSDGLRLLDRISHAKNSVEILKIEKEEKTKILLEEFNFYQKKKFFADMEFQKVKLKYNEDSIEYKKALLAKEKADTEFTQASSELVKVRIENAKTEKEKLKQALDYMFAVSDQVFGMIEKSLDESLNATNDLVKQAQIKNQQQGIAIAKQGLSAIASLASGDIPGAIMQGIGIVFNGLDLIINGSKRKAEAAILQSRQVLKTYLDFIQSDIDEFINSLDTVKKLYGDIAGNGATFVVQSNLDKLLKDLLNYNNAIEALKDTNSIAFQLNLPDFSTIGLNVDQIFEKIAKGAKDSGFSITDLVNAEVKRGEKIAENANKARDLEEANYQKIISNINSAFDLEIKKITQKYDYESIRAAQQYNAQTLAITTAGTAQLEALIKNEESLASVRAEFAGKRLAIEQAFPLAAIAITEGMSDAEIKAINDSIAARDAALAKIQASYNTELVAIVNAEGQKRKEYTATETIQNAIQANLDAAALKFQGEEIQRAKDKAIAIEAEEAKRIANLETAETSHKANLLKIQTDYNNAIAESYKVLTALLKAQQKEIEDAMTNTAAKGSEEYYKLEQQLYRVKAALDSITGKTVTVLNVTNGTAGAGLPGFATGTDRLQNMNGRSGVDSQLIRADVGERILTKEQNNTLRRVYGRDLGNKEVVKILTQTPKFLSITQTGDIGELVRREAKMSINLQMQGLSREITDMKNTLSKDLNNLPITQTSFDNRGFTRGIKTRTSFTEQKKNKYFNV